MSPNVVSTPIILTGSCLALPLCREGSHGRAVFDKQFDTFTNTVSALNL